MPASLPLVLGLASLGAGALAACAAWLRVRRIRKRFETLLDQALAWSRSARETDQDTNESARRAFVNLARRIQALVNRQSRELREMESRHGADAGVFGDLLHLDHGTALIGRLADSLAVLGGDRPGRRWSKAIPVLGVLRGAMSRIAEYRRVDIGPLPEQAALDGEFAEPLIHALAELLDNATRYSPPDSRVELRAFDVPDGLVIEVVDAGVGMGPEALARAQLALTTESVGLELSALGRTPGLGLAVVGRLSRAAGFAVTLDRPGDGGVRAVIRVPATLLRKITGPPDLETAEGTTTEDTTTRPVHSEGGSSHRVTAPADVPPPVLTAHGLPKRQHSGNGSRAAASAASTSSTSTSASTSDRRPGLWLGPFHAGLNGDENGARR